MSTKKDKSKSLTTCKKCKCSLTNKSKCQNCQNKMLINTLKSTTTTQSINSSSNTPQLPSQNVTIRQKRKSIQKKEIITHSHSDNEDSSFLSINTEFRTSLPDLSTRVNEDIDDLKQKIEELSLQLESAHLEIDNLTLEKNYLLEKIAHQEMKLSTLSAISTPTSIKKKKIKSIPGPSGIQHLNPNNSILSYHCTNSQEENNDNPPIVLTGSQTIIPEHIKNEEDPKINSEPVNTNNIYIYGTQQTSGLALALLKSREKSKYEKYTVSSFTKPFADSEEVLRGCHTHIQSPQESCKVIICIGENDSNPIKVTTELGALLKKLKNCSVLVLNILQNRYLNEKLLNTNLRLICKAYKNCYFVENSMYYENYLTDICNKINFCVDYIDYKNSYLDVKFIKRRLQVPQSVSKYAKNTQRSKLKQKVMLDYFPLKHAIPLDNNINISNTQFFRT